MNIDQLQSKSIDLLRFPLAVAVILAHTANAITMDPEQMISTASISGMDVYNMLTTIFVKNICPTAVPVFFIISGYLYFRNVKEWNTETYISKNKSRLRTLLIPYVLWITISFTAAIAKSLVIYYNTGEVIGILQQLSSISGWIKPFWGQWEFGPVQNSLGFDFYIYYPHNGALWFLRDLIGACLLSPIIYLIVRYLKAWGLLLLAIAYYTNIWIHIPGFGVEVFFFFGIGAYFGVHKKNMLEQIRKIRIPAAILAIGALLLMILGTPQFVPFTIPIRLYSTIFVVSMCITWFNIAATLINSGKVEENKNLTQTSFFIFAAHGAVITATAGIFSKIFSANTILIKSLQFFLFPIIVAIICIIGYYTLKKIAPKVLSVLVGSRL